MVILLPSNYFFSGCQSPGFCNARPCCESFGLVAARLCPPRRRDQCLEPYLRLTNGVGQPAGPGIATSRLRKSEDLPCTHLVPFHDFYSCSGFWGLGGRRESTGFLLCQAAFHLHAKRNVPLLSELIPRNQQKSQSVTSTCSIGRSLELWSL